MTETVYTGAQVDRIIASGGKFLRTLSQHPTIMHLMLGLGYSAEAHAEGWRLYLPLIGYDQNGTTPAVSAPLVNATEQHKALLEVDQFDDNAFKRSKAALEHLFPAQALYMFRGLEARKGVESLGSTTIYLDRYVALRDGTDPERKGSRKEDKKAAAELEARNIITPEKEQHLRALIELAQQLAPEPVVVDMTDQEIRMQKAAGALKAWLDDWRETAAAGITRRDYQILLGLAKRRGKKKGEVAEPGKGTA